VTELRAPESAVSGALRAEGFVARRGGRLRRAPGSGEACG